MIATGRFSRSSPRIVGRSARPVLSVSTSATGFPFAPKSFTRAASTGTSFTRSDTNTVIVSSAFFLARTARSLMRMRRVSIVTGTYSGPPAFTEASSFFTIPVSSSV